MGSAKLGGRLAKIIFSASAAIGLGLPGLWMFGPTHALPVPSFPNVAQWRADGSAPPDPMSTSPARIAAYFGRLQPGQGESLARRYPQIVGNLDGAPLALRYLANQIQAPHLANRQIMLYDPRGDGRIAEVFGDLAGADRVAILVPGDDNTLSNFDTGLGGSQRRAPSWMGRQLYERIRALDPAERVAVVTWLGYDPPKGVRRDAMREDRAATGAAELQRFVAGLTADRPQAAITVIGHSYGSTVVGLAAPRLSHKVTDIIAIGSPGMGGADTVADLHTSARVWAGTAPNDWTRRVPGIKVFGLGHGRLPFDPSFGALPIPVADVDSHDGYFVPGTSALSAMAGIAIGRAGDVR